MEKLIEALNKTLETALVVRNAGVSPDGFIEVCKLITRAMDVQAEYLICGTVSNVYGLTNEEQALVFKNQRLEAIKLIRFRTDCDLKTGKDMVDSFRANNMEETPNGWVRKTKKND